MINLVRLIYSYLRYQTGQTNHVYITSGYTPGTNEHYFYFKVLENSTVSYTNKLGTTVTDKALLAGDEVFGQILTLTCSVGEIRAYFL